MAGRSVLTASTVSTPEPAFHPNFVWQSLSGHQAHFAAGSDDARRYAPGFSTIIGFADQQNPNFAAIAPYCEPGEHFYCIGWSGPVAPGWKVDAESKLINMRWDAPPPQDEETGVQRLGAEHVPQALALTALTKPGPFGPRTIEFGEYYGVFDAGHLVAMAGERMHYGAFREISGVCTQADFQGRGLARRLMAVLLRRQIARGETPFLSVMHDNVAARRTYVRMGFAECLESPVRVVSRA